MDFDITANVTLMFTFFFSFQTMHFNNHQTDNACTLTWTIICLLSGQDVFFEEDPAQQRDPITSKRCTPRHRAGPQFQLTVSSLRQEGRKQVNLHLN